MLDGIFLLHRNTYIWYPIIPYNTISNNEYYFLSSYMHHFSWIHPLPFFIDHASKRLILEPWGIVHFDILSPISLTLSCVGTICQSGWPFTPDHWYILTDPASVIHIDIYHLLVFHQYMMYNHLFTTHISVLVKTH